jgi:hypothetical protein
MSGRCLVLVMVFGGVGAPAVRADEVATTGGVRHRSVQVTAVEAGHLVCVDDAGGQAEIPLAEVRRITIGGWEAINRAELSVAGGRYGLGIRRYLSVLEAVEGRAAGDDDVPRGRRELVLARLLRAYDAEGRFEAAARCYVALCRAWGEGAVGVMPTHRPAAGSREHEAVTALLEDAARELGAGAAWAAVRAFREAMGGAPRAGETAATQAASPESETASAEPFGRIEAMVEGGDAGDALTEIEAGLRAGDGAAWPAWLYWRGRALEAMARGDEGRLRAALAYMRVPIHFGDDSRAAECLFRAARLHAAAGLRERVEGLVREALEKKPTGRLRRDCERLLRRVRR